VSAAAARASITHRGDGRTRLRFRGERGNASFFEELVAKLTSVPGIVQIETRPDTGSVLVFHEIPWPELAGEFSHRSLFTIAGEDEENAAPDLGAIAANLPAPLVVAGGLAALAALQIAKGRVLPPAITLLWYGYELTSRLLHQPNKE
jgi:hypothetical protein